MKTNISKITLSLATLLSLSATTVCADNLLQNGSFEDFTVLKEKKNWKKVQLEYWNEPTKINLRGENPTDGNSKIALDSSRTLNLLTQTITTLKDGTYTLSVDTYAPKRRLSTAGFEIIVDGEVVGTFRATEDWENYKVSFVGKGGEQSVGFREIASENDNKGVFLDNAELSVKAPVQTIDLAQNFGKATQGSSPSYARAYHNANMGIDGNISTYIYTNSGTESWYQVEIPKGSKVAKLMIQSGEYKPYRLKDAKVYVSNTPYNQTVNGLEEVGTLKGDTSEQIIQFDTPKEIRYVIVKGKDKLHIGSLEVLGKAPQTPTFNNSNFNITIDKWQGKAETVFDVNSTDYQGDSISYSIDGDVPFAIDGNGALHVTSTLNAGVYNVNVVVSDGTYSQTRVVTINVRDTPIVKETYSVKDKTPNISGYLPNIYSNGDSFTITINGVEYNPTINDNGTWSIDGEDLEALNLGKYDLVMNINGEHITYANYIDIYGDRYLKRDFNFDMSSFSNQEVNVTNSMMDYPEKEEYFRGSSIELKVENGKAKIINKSYKRYKSVLVKYTDANGKDIFKELTFDKAIEPHTINEVTRFTNDEIMSIVNTAGLFDLELGFGGFEYQGTYCTEETLANDPTLIYCMPLHAGQENLRYTDTSKVVTEQQDAYDTLMGTFNHFYNSVDAYPAMQSWMKMEPYKGTEPVSLNTGAYVKELNAHNGEDYVSENFYHAVLPNDKIRLTILQNDGGVYGRGNGKSSSLFGIDEHPNHGYISMVDWTMDRDFYLRMYDSVHHEMMHAKGYSHESGMTYGWSQFVRSYIQYNPNHPYTVHVNPEAIVPKYIFSTKKLDSHTVQVTLQKKEGAIGQDLTLEVLSSSYLVGDDITIERRAEDALNQVTISVNPNIKTRLIIRAFGEDSLEVMSKFVTLD